MRGRLKINKYLVLILFIQLWFCYHVFSQSTVLKHYSIADGMPSSECYDVKQDSKGYIWIGTDAGVVRYDGYQFKTYNNNKGLVDNTVFKIKEDKQGRIWFLTYSGRLFYYLYQTDSIYSIPANKLLSEVIKRFPSSMEIDNNGKFYISNYTSGYIEVSPPYDKVKSFSNADNKIFVKEIDDDHFIYGRDIPFGGKRPNFINLSFLPINPQSDFIDSLLKLRSVITHVSVVKLNREEYLLSDGSSLVKISSHSKQIMLDTLPYFKSVGGIVSIFNDKQNRIWVNTGSHGTYVFENADFTDQPIHLLENLTISCVFEDDENGFWITTVENGLYYLPSLKFKFLNKSSGLSTDKVLSVYRYHNKLLALTSDNTINEIDLSDNKISVYAKHKSSTWHLSGDENILIDCGNDPAFINLSTKEKIMLWLRAKDGILMQPSVRKAINYNEKYYLGFGVVEVFLIDKKTGECLILHDNFPTIFSIYPDNDRILVGTKEGLYSLKNTQVEYFGDLNPLLKNRIVDIVKCNDVFFLATKGAGVVCVKDNRVVKVFNEANGLPSDICKSMISDKDGNVWVGTNRGIFGIKMKNGRLVVNGINLIKAFISSEINQVIEKDHTLYFATSNGVGLMAINDLYTPSTKIPVYIEGFWVNGIKQRFDTLQTFDYSQNSIKIEYKGILQKREGDLHYRYKLEGLDTSWVYTKDIQVQLSILPPGNYTFSVYVLNENGLYSSVPAKFSFCIRAPFWSKWWFYLIEICFVAFVIYFLYRRRIAMIRKTEEEKTAINKQIAESELTALRAQMNPHFIFNAINSIQHFILKNDSASAHKYLTKFARLIRSVLENSKRETILLSHEVEALTLYIELEALRASFSFDFSIKVHTDTNADNVLIPPMLIQPFVENAILHGLMPLSERRGHLAISFSQEGSVLKCVIEDNGIGRAAAEEIKQKKSTKHVSMGTSVTQERLDILNKQNGIPTQVKIIDKYDDGEATGTIVEICIELKRK